LALLWKRLSSLGTDVLVFRNVGDLRWRGPTDAFAACVERLGDARLIKRSLAAQTAAAS
jgi:hypothetical protein